MTEKQVTSGIIDRDYSSLHGSLPVNHAKYNAFSPYFICAGPWSALTEYLQKTMLAVL
jgi:hypothetical protein